MNVKKPGYHKPVVYPNRPAHPLSPETKAILACFYQEATSQDMVRVCLITPTNLVMKPLISFYTPFPRYVPFAAYKEAYCERDAAMVAAILQYQNIVWPSTPK